MSDLTFDDLRAVNVARCEVVFHPINDWSPTDWACAMAGECGEACNEVKKLRRLDGEEIEQRSHWMRPEDIEAIQANAREHGERVGRIAGLREAVRIATHTITVEDCAFFLMSEIEHLESEAKEKGEK